jgi:hypothetical protein
MAHQAQQQAPQQAQQPAAAPATLTGRLRGETPDVFNGDRRKSETFIQQFNVHWGLNDNHEIMQVPYLRTMYALSLIKGPLVKDWANDQVVELRNKVSRANNPILRDDNTLWNEFNAAFIAAFSDTARVQNAHMSLQHLKMRGDDLDTYISTFRHLAKEANYDLTATATVHIFARGLEPKLRSAILHRETLPITMAEWENAARMEKEKYTYRQSFMYPDHQRYKWVSPQQQRRNGNRRHPNDEVVPMDVDPPVFTRINRAYTEADKNRFKQEGRCFFCDQQGHMARNCPVKKQQFSKPPQQGKRKPFNRPKQSSGFRKSNKPKPHCLGYNPRARVASIEEIDSDEENEAPDVPSLAARTAKLSEEQREDWLQEMRDLGMDF